MLAVALVVLVAHWPIDISCGDVTQCKTCAWSISSWLHLDAFPFVLEHPVQAVPHLCDPFGNILKCKMATSFGIPFGASCFR